ncbi:hypothetical protein FRC12_017775 [Ceratobasidium sp. 428]|nr:hypothetical protein FRC12_017775 [Ceratobasidium sp. 428]
MITRSLRVESTPPETKSTTTPARWLATVIPSALKKPSYIPRRTTPRRRGATSRFISRAPIVRVRQSFEYAGRGFKRCINFDGPSNCNVFKRLSNAAHTPNEAKTKTKTRALDVPSRRKSVEYEIDDEDEDDRPKSRSKPEASSSRAPTKYIKQVPVSDDKESDNLLPAKDILRDKRKSQTFGEDMCSPIV